MARNKDGDTKAPKEKKPGRLAQILADLAVRDAATFGRIAELAKGA